MAQPETKTPMAAQPAPSRESATDRNDARLVERIARGDIHAFEELYCLYATPIFSYACHSLRNREDAEEILQDTFARVWANAGRFDPGKSKPFTWTMMIVRGLCVDRIRYRSAKRRATSVELTEANEPTTSGDRTIERLCFAETVEHVRAALETLPSADRQCLEMAVFGDITHSQIADQLKAPLGTIKSRVRRGLQKVRTHLRHHDS